MWDAADAYQRYMGRWSAAVARTLLDRAPLAAEARCLDVGCGTGSLSRVVTERLRPAWLVGVDPSPAFLGLARRAVASLTPVQADAARLPLADATFDVAVSGLVLNFVPRPGQALAEMARVLRPGGSLVAYVWDYDHLGFFLTRFWEGLEAIGGRRSPDDERGRWVLCSDEGFTELLAGAPLGDVRIMPIVVDTVFRDTDELWDGFLLGVGPSGRAATSLDADGRARLRAWLAARWPVGEDGTVRLTARALTAVGTVR